MLGTPVVVAEDWVERSGGEVLVENRRQIGDDGGDVVKAEVGDVGGVGGVIPARITKPISSYK